MREYEETRRPVYEQVLRLSQDECESVWQALKTNYLPQNRQYLYNFVFDNCATRPYKLIANALGIDTIASSYTGYTGCTYRSFIRHYTGSLSWANAGITLIFGPKADQQMSSQQRLFLPEELMHYMSGAYMKDSLPLVYEGETAPFVIASTPWYASWLLGLAGWFLLVVTVSLYDRRKGRLSWWPEITVGIPYILLLFIVAFLTFFSCHPLVGFGWRLLVLPFTHLCARLVYIVR